MVLICQKLGLFCSCTGGFSRLTTLAYAARRARALLNAVVIVARLLLSARGTSISREPGGLGRGHAAVALNRALLGLVLTAGTNLTRV